MPVWAEDGETNAPRAFRKVASNIFRPFNSEAIGRSQEVIDHKIVHLRFVFESVGVQVQEVTASPVNCKEGVGWAGYRLDDVPGSR